MDRRAVYGPRDGTVLSQQSQHRSDEILDGNIDEVLQAKRADGFAPEEGALKGSRLQVKAIIHHISRVHITPDTPHLTVVQYARVVALLLLGGKMCPDSSGYLVSLLYLAKLENIVAARNYSWGSAVLAFLYRELCNASEKGKAAIGGALQLVQI
ncbi:UNVERIFIED_CONTAM: protein MAINTENANCE OF MERISTEMS [Sesamum angustifolium]|uniref:Protein MAINTENANCE OF MERISTEMS n=1 Tax=Sesamum angustifolium TaxID=2727405 RepID=A0AAW2RMS9_9LAMI